MVYIGEKPLPFLIKQLVVNSKKIGGAALWGQTKTD